MPSESPLTETIASGRPQSDLSAFQNGIAVFILDIQCREVAVGETLEERERRGPASILDFENDSLDRLVQNVPGEMKCRVFRHVILQPSRAKSGFLSRLLLLDRMPSATRAIASLQDLPRYRPLSLPHPPG